MLAVCFSLYLYAYTPATGLHLSSCACISLFSHVCCSAFRSLYLGVSIFVPVSPPPLLSQFPFQAGIIINFKSVKPNVVVWSKNHVSSFRLLILDFSSSSHNRKSLNVSNGSGLRKKNVYEKKLRRSDALLRRQRKRRRDVEQLKLTIPKWWIRNGARKMKNRRNFDDFTYLVNIHKHFSKVSAFLSSPVIKKIK